MQSVSSRIWTRIDVFISYGDNDYTTGTSPHLLYDDERYAEYASFLNIFSNK